MEKINVNAEFIFEFASFQSWVNKAKRTIGGFGRYQQIVCIDKNGNLCFIGEDFMIARDNDLFPVRAYRLIRTNESV